MIDLILNESCAWLSLDSHSHARCFIFPRTAVTNGRNN